MHTNPARRGDDGDDDGDVERSFDWGIFHFVKKRNVNGLLTGTFPPALDPPPLCPSGLGPQRRPPWRSIVPSSSVPKTVRRPGCRTVLETTDTTVLQGGRLRVVVFPQQDQ